MTRAQRQTVLARCYVALAEVDYDLRAWAELLRRPMVAR